MDGFYSWEDYSNDVTLEKLTEERKKGRNIFEFLKRTVTYTFEYHRIIFMCKHFGHKLESEYDVGPEYGIEYIDCQRCGLSYRHIYY